MCCKAETPGLLPQLDLALSLFGLHIQTHPSSSPSTAARLLVHHVQNATHFTLVSDTRVVWLTAFLYGLICSFRDSTIPLTRLLMGQGKDRAFGTSVKHDSSFYSSSVQCDTLDQVNPNDYEN